MISFATAGLTAEVFKRPEVFIQILLLHAPSRCDPFSLQFFKFSILISILSWSALLGLPKEIPQSS
jgi:hypothetical protein